MNDDERAMMMLEKSIYEVKEILEREYIFRPFAMILDQNGEIRRVENEIEDMQDAYLELHAEITGYVEKTDSVDIIVLLTNSSLPEQISKEGIESGIRVHIEERSQQHKTIASRFIYIPYQLQRLSREEQVEAKLFHPQAISFPSEFFKKEE
ncbi:MAG: hypothetical protein ABXS92_04305 [Sulfurimonas sp.]